MCEHLFSFKLLCIEKTSNPMIPCARKSLTTCLYCARNT